MLSAITVDKLDPYKRHSNLDRDLTAAGVGKEKLFMFVVTIIGVLATDLLIGVAIGTVAQFAMHMLRGVRLNNLFKIHFVIEKKTI